VVRPDNRELTNEQVLADLQRVAKALGKKTLTFKEYVRHGICTSRMFTGRFGSWNKALEAAGLEVRRRINIPTEELFNNLARVWQELGRQPVGRDMVMPLSTFSMDPYEPCFGGWRNALRAFAKWADEGVIPEEVGSARRAAPGRKSRNPILRLRFAVLRRDSFKCTACGRNPATNPGTELHVDHKIPWSRGGPTTLDNLTTLCEKCNLGKGDL